DASGELHAIGDERRDHHRDRPGEGDGGPGAIGEEVTRVAGAVKGQQQFAPGDVRTAPCEPEQPQRPERHRETEGRADEIIPDASDHETAASLLSERPPIIDEGGDAGALAGADTRRTEPPCSLASAATSSWRATPSQWRMTL